MKKSDFVLLSIVLGIAIIVFSIFQLISRPDPHFFKVTVEGNVYGIYSLTKDQEIFINQKNKLKVKDRYVEMLEANCPDQICVKHKCISKRGETIICLPNHVVVEILGDMKEFDAISK